MTEDTYRGDPKDPLSLNLYTYCHNEPMMYTDPTGHIDQWDEDREWGDYDHDGTIDSHEDDDDDDNDGTPDWTDPDSEDYMNPNAPGYGSNNGNKNNNKNDDDDDDDSDPIAKAINKLKKEIEYRKYMGETGLAKNAEEILAQIEMLKNTIGQLKATNNWSLNSKSVYTASLDDRFALEVLAKETIKNEIIENSNLPEILNAMKNAFSSNDVVICIGANATIAKGGVRVGRTFAIAIDGKGNIGIIDSKAGGIGTTTASVSVQLTVANAEDIFTLSDEGKETGGSTPWVGVEYARGIDGSSREKTWDGGNFTYTLINVWPVPYEGHDEMSDTNVILLISGSDLMNRANDPKYIYK